MVRILFLFAGLQLFGAMVIANDDVTKLLDKLVEVTEPGFGYSAYFSGSEFLPYADTGKWELSYWEQHAVRAQTHYVKL